MSPPPDRRPASSGLLDPPKAHWATSADDGWFDDQPVDRGHRPSGRRPPTPSGRDQNGSRARGGRRFVYPVRRWPRRLLVAVNVIVALFLVAAGSVYGYVNWRLNQIHRIAIPTLNGTAVPPGAPMTILVVGSDSRTGLAGGDSKQFGSASQVGGQRSDTIMLVHVDPASTSATLMSIPRDLWVQVPGKTTHDRINTTFDSGPDVLVKAIQQTLGITIDHYVEVNFQSFREVVNAVGGVREYFPTPARDAYSLLNIPAPGCYTLQGDMALSFVRARHYEYKLNGRWLYEAESDLARIKRQQSFIKKTIAKAQGSGLTNPIELNRIISGVTKNLTLDSGFSQNLLLSLGKRFRNLSPGSLPTATLPTTPTVINGADVLLLQQPAAQQAISDFTNPPRPATPATGNQTPSTVSSLLPSSVRVAVLNGSGRAGEAAKASSDLQRQGFMVTTSHSAANFNFTSSQIRYVPGNEAKARLLASAIQGPTQLQADSTLQGADLELITGQSYLGVTAVPNSSGGTATTSPGSTAPGTPATTTYELPGSPAGFVAPTC